MAEQSNELKKLATIAADLGLSAELRIKSIELIGSIGTHDALLILLDLAANRELIKEERDIALQHASEIIKSGR
jgi:1-aminocyclopropane-1-carboxylate deaminase/D-cysteine desulfhydrase-like pyridoxal-dependent ACC family enzyme